MKKLAFALLLFLGPQSLFAQAARRLPSGVAVYIEPMNGFETYLSAALLKKKVPVRIVSDRAQAQYIISGISDNKEASWAKELFVSTAPHSSASIAMKDAKTGDMVYAYAVDKLSSFHARQSTAEACAKHMNNDVFKAGEKAEKEKW